jgi:hypothetical protein
MVFSTFRKQLILSLFLILASILTYAQVTVSGAVSGNGNYSTLSAAFTAIGTSQPGANIIVEINANITETGTVTIGAGNWASVLVRPAGGAARTVSGAIPAGSALINFNGADNVTFDGLNTGGNSLTLSNTTVSSTSGTCTVVFQGDATNNTITNCTVLGSSTMSTTTNGGTIYFAAGAVTTGNDNNTISNCNIGPAGSNLPTKAIYGNGTTTSTATYNSGIQITGCQIYDYFNAAAQSNGIYVSGGCTDWTISNNKFYQTATRTQTTGAVHSAIQLASLNINNCTISGNTIGYASGSGTGSYNFAGLSSSKFYPIYVSSHGTTTATSIQGNTITAISVSGTLSGTSTSSPCIFIFVNSGLANNITGNTIGSTTASGAISFSSSSTSASDVMGIYFFPSASVNISNNQVGGISASNSSTGSIVWYGLYAYTGSSYTNTFQNNTVGYSAAPITVSASSTSSRCIGIYSRSGIGVINGNTISNLTINSVNTGTGTSAALVGLYFDLTTAAAANNISQNTIHSLSATGAGAVVVHGLLYNGATATSGTHTVQRNFIHSLSVADNAATMNGIYINGGTTTFVNNMVRLGINASGSAITAGCVINGISETIAGTDNIYHNSIYIGGAGVAGSNNTYAFQSTITTNTRAYRNNIFVNARSNGSGTGKHYAVRVGGTGPNPAGLTINNNIYYTSGTGGTFGFFNSADVANLGAWQTAVGQDANSYSVDPLFVGPTNATPDLHVQPGSPADQVGAALGISNDFDGELRSSLSPNDIGADAFLGAACSGTPSGGTISATSANACSGGTYTMSVSSATSGSGITYQWEVSLTSGSGFVNVSGGSGATTTSYTTGTLSAGTYYYRLKVYCSNSSSTAYSDELALTVIASPTVSVSPASSTYCGGNKTLTASGATTYSWSPSINLSATTGSSVDVTASSATPVTYTVTGTTNGCTATATAVVNPGNALTSTASATPSSGCTGFSSNLTVVTTQSATVNSFTYGTSTGASLEVINSPTTVTSVTSGSLDDGYISVSPSFTFPYEGTNYTSFQVGTNGYVRLGNTGSTSIPINLTSIGGINAIFAFGRDANLNTTYGGNLTHGAASGGKYVFQFTNLSGGSTGGTSSTIYATIQIVLWGTNSSTPGKIEIIYGPNAGTPASAGTIGIVDAANLYLNGTNGLTNSLATASAWPAAGTLYSFTPPTLSYAWSEQFPVPANLSATNIQSPTATNVTTAETYTVTVSEPGGCSVTTSTTVTISSSSLSVGATASVNPVCSGASTNISATVTGGCTPYTYAWSNGAGNVSSFSATPSGPSTTYTVTVTDANSTTATANVIVTVNTSPTVTITPTPPSANICGSGSVSLAVSGANTYTWSSGSGNPNVVSPTSTTTYTVTGTDGNGCTATASKTVSVYPLPTVTATATPSTVCSGANSQLLATPTQIAGANFYTFSTTTGETLEDMTSSTQIVSSGSDDVSSATQNIGFSFLGYTQFSANSNGLMLLGTATSTAYTNDLSSAPGYPAIAPAWDDLHTGNNGGVFFKTTGTAPNRKLIVEWRVRTFAESGNYTRTMQVWLFEATGVVQLVYGAYTGTMDFASASVGITSGSTSYNSVTTSTHTASTITADNSNTLWPGSGRSYIFTPPAVTWNYSWSESIPATTNLSATNIANPLANAVTTGETYTVTVTNTTSGCTATASAVVSVASGSMTASISPATPSICSGQSVTLTASQTGGSTPVTYNWNTGESVAAITKSPASTTTYTVTVTDACSTTASASVSVSVTTTPVVTITSNPANANICGSGSVQLTATGATSYSWSSGSGNPNTVSPTVTTVYTVTGTTSGCTATATKTVSVYNAPSVTVSATPATICVGSNSSLSATPVQTFNVTHYSFAASTGTFTPITGGTAVATTVSAADFLGDTKTSVNIPIGFSFNYEGVAYTQLKAMSDGYITFNLSNTSNLTNNLATGAARPCIAPLWDDLDGASGSGSASYVTTGTPGNRVFTIEWLNWQWNYSASGATISFQVKLYEADGKIEFIYRQESGAVNSGSASIGLAGATSGKFLSLNGTGASPVANSATETTTLNTKPATGQVYTFTPPAVPTWGYAWSPATFLNSTSIANPTAQSVTSSLAYTVTVTNNTTGCTAASNVSVNTTSAPSATASNTGPYNVGDNIVLDAGTVPSATYAWSGPNGFTSSLEDPTISNANPSMSGNYTVTVTGSNSCTATATTTVVVNPPTTYTWSGAVSTAWGTPGNWVGGVVPGNNCGSNVIIPNTTNKPVVSSPVTLGDLSLANGALITLQANMSLCGNVTAGTSLSQVTGAGVLRFVGNSPQTITGKLSADNVLVNNSSGVTLLPGSVLNMYEILDLQSGNLTTTGATLTLKSSAAKTALIRNQGSAAIAGTITMERQLTNFYGYHHISSPVIDATVSEWADDFTIKGTNGANASYFKQEGTLQEYREYQNGTNLLDSGYYNYTNLLNPLTSGKGLTAIANPVLIETRGTPGNGDISVTITKTGTKATAGYNFLGNPYPSPISWSSFRDAPANAGKMGGSCYIWKSTGGGYRNGTWVTYNGVTGIGGVGNIIGSHQAFWVFTTLSSTSVTFSNANRTIDLSPVFQKYQQEQPNEVRLELWQNNTQLNEIVAYSSASASDNFDFDEDALMPDNRGNEFAFNVNEEKYLINVTNDIDEDKELPLHIDVMEDGIYTIGNTVNNTHHANMYLYDKVRQTYTDIKEKAVDVALSAGKNDNYSIVFKRKEVTDNRSEGVKIYSTGNVAVIDKAGDEFAEIKIYNALGQVISTAKGTNNRFLLPVYGVESGIFTVLVVAGGKSYTEKVYIANR